MILLQPHADDSGSDPQSHTFVYGGLIASPSRWLEFTPVWQSALNSGPIKLDYFKTTEAMSLTEQFSLTRGWDREKRDRKLSELAEIVLDYAQYGAWVVMRQADFKTYLRGIPLPYRDTATDTPYLFMIAQFILLVCEDARRHGTDCVFDFILDQQEGIDALMANWWPKIKEIAADNGLASFLDERPTFKDEKSILPLQAADLFAWQHRKHLENNKAIIMPQSPILRRLSQVRTISTAFNGESLSAIHAVALKMATEFVEENPGTPMYLAGKAQRRLSKEKPKKKPSSKGRA